MQPLAQDNIFKYFQEKGYVDKNGYLHPPIPVNAHLFDNNDKLYQENFPKLPHETLEHLCTNVHAIVRQCEVERKYKNEKSITVAKPSVDNIANENDIFHTYDRDHDFRMKLPLQQSELDSLNQKVELYFSKRENGES